MTFRRRFREWIVQNDLPPKRQDDPDWNREAPTLEQEPDKLPNFKPYEDNDRT